MAPLSWQRLRLFFSSIRIFPYIFCQWMCSVCCTENVTVRLFTLERATQCLLNWSKKYGFLIQIIVCFYKMFCMFLSNAVLYNSVEYSFFILKYTLQTFVLLLGFFLGGVWCWLFVAITCWRRESFPSELFQCLYSTLLLYVTYLLLDGKTMIVIIP